jgi:parvulin-like peptidyl-prolyl isomerase
VTATVKVSDADLKQYYDQHQDQYSQPASREVRHILVKDKGTADKLYSQLKGGADFAALAKKFSQDPGSKSLGGKLTVSKGQTVPPFDKVAFSLKTKELSQPVKTQYGWHVIQALSAVKPAKKTPFAQVKEAIRQQLLQQKRSEAMSKWVDDLKKEYASKINYATGFAPAATGTTGTTGTATTG